MLNIPVVSPADLSAAKTAAEKTAQEIWKTILSYPGQAIPEVKVERIPDRAMQMVEKFFASKNWVISAYIQGEKSCFKINTKWHDQKSQGNDVAYTMVLDVPVAKTEELVRIKALAQEVATEIWNEICTSKTPAKGCQLSIDRVEDSVINVVKEYYRENGWHIHAVHYVEDTTSFTATPITMKEEAQEADS